MLYVRRMWLGIVIVFFAKLEGRSCAVVTYCSNIISVIDLLQQQCRRGDLSPWFVASCVSFDILHGRMYAVPDIKPLPYFWWKDRIVVVLAMLRAVYWWNSLRKSAFTKASFIKGRAGSERAQCCSQRPPFFCQGMGWRIWPYFSAHDKREPWGRGWNEHRITDMCARRSTWCTLLATMALFSSDKFSPKK